MLSLNSMENFTNKLFNKLFVKELQLITNSMILVGYFFIVSFALNDTHVLSFQEQLALLSKPNMVNLSLILVGIFQLFKLLKEIVSAAKGSEISGKFSSVWVPIQYIIFVSFFMPFQQDGVQTSIMIETFKSIIHFLAN
jgi:hypothetical protein